MKDSPSRYDVATDMLRAVGHDLKSPLTAIIGSLEALSTFGGRLSDTQRETLYKTALKECYRLQNFVQNILLMCRIESDAFTLTRENFPLNDILKPLLAKLKQQYPQLVIRENATDTITLSNIDPRWLSEALWQIFDNIGRHNLETVSGSIDVKDLGKQVEIIVGDSGTGIAPDLASCVFDKHVKGEATAHQDASAGVGLTAARAIIQAHGGTITVEPYASGAYFRVVLPKK